MHAASVELLLDGPRFAKLCRECGLLGGGLDIVRVDLIFKKLANKVCFKEGGGG